MSWDFLAFVPKEILDQFSSTMLRVLLNRSFARLYEVVPPEDKKRFDDFLTIEGVDEDELLRRSAFLEQHSFHFKRILVEEAQAIEREFAEFVEREEYKEE